MRAKQQTRLPRSLATFPFNNLSQFDRSPCFNTVKPKMQKHFCLCLSLKTGAIIMSFLNLLEGSVTIVAGIIELSNLENKGKFERIPKKYIKGACVEKMCNKTDICNTTSMNEVFPASITGNEGHITLILTTWLLVVVGVLSVFNGILLMLGVLKDKEKYILLYLLLGSVNLFIATLYVGIKMLHNRFWAVIFLLPIFVWFLLVGALLVFNGILLMLGLLKDKEKYILLHVLLGSFNLFIVTLYAGINMFDNGILAIVFFLSIFVCYGQLAMYNFYEAVAEYNNVKSGVIEIAFNENAKSYVNSVVPTDEAVDTTAV